MGIVWKFNQVFEIRLVPGILFPSSNINSSIALLYFLNCFEIHWIRVMGFTVPLEKPVERGFMVLEFGLWSVDITH